MLLGEKIRFFGDQKFGSIKKYAEALDMKPSSLQKYLNGDREPGTGILKKMLNLGCDINWLLDEDSSLVKEKQEKYDGFDIKKAEDLKKQLAQLELNEIIHRLSELEKILKK